MISLTLLDGSPVSVDPGSITWIDLTRETIVALVGGERFAVRESLHDIVVRIASHRKHLSVPLPDKRRNTTQAATSP